MGWLALALGAAGLVSGAASAKSQASAATRAADTQAQASVEAARIQADTARQGIDLERSIYQDQRNLYAPQARLGAGALARQAVMAGVSPEEARGYYSGVDAAYSSPGALATRSYAAPDAATAARTNPKFAMEAAEQGAREGRYISPEEYATAWFANPANAPYFDEAMGVSAPQQAAAPAPSSGADPLEGYTATSWMTTDPGYAFRRDEGAKALERSAVASGGAFGGAYDKALTRYGQDYASNEYQNAFNRLGVISGAGQTATGALSTAATNYGQNAGGYITNAGDAQAQGVASAGNARASGYQAAGNAWGDFWGNTVPGAVGTAAGAFAGKKGWF